MNTSFKALLFLAAATNVLGCRFVCEPPCRYGSRLLEEQTTVVKCEAGTKVGVTSPFGPFTSCDSVRVSSGKGCSVEKTSLGDATVTCSANTDCKLDWKLLFSTCLCDASGPCDGKCDTVPSCRADEVLSRTPCSDVKGECRSETECCVEANCVPKGCDAGCGITVPSGWAGKGFGSNWCNDCGCSNGALRCTRAACARQNPACLTKGSVCKQQWGQNIWLDRSAECPPTTKCTLKSAPLTPLRTSVCL